MFIDTTQRTTQEEFLDDFSLAGDALGDALDKIAAINQWLGGNNVTLSGLQELLKNHPKNQPVSLIDIGCGNGDMCRAMADFGARNGFQFTIVGVDANAYTVSHARQCSTNYPGIRYETTNVFDKAFAETRYDIAVCTLTLHHFTDPEILYLMRLLSQQARLGIVINDLHRSGLAYRLFQLIAFVFQLSPLSREDGLVSILRGFKKQDLDNYSRQLNFSQYRIRWKWAFRYQWLIKNLCA